MDLKQVNSQGQEWLNSVRRGIAEGKKEVIVLTSILQEDWDVCYLCGRNRTADPCGLEEHHVFGGSNRKFSEKYGLKIHICGERCHRNGPESVHRNRQVDLAVKAAGQETFEKEYSHEKFMEIFKKNYI